MKWARRSVILALLPATLIASGVPDAAYQHGVLTGFTTVSNGMHCAGSGQTNEDGATYGSGNCSNRYMRLYTVQVADHSYTLSKAITKKKRGLAAATLGWSAAFEKGSVLSNQLPNTPILVRSDEHGMYVRIGKKESKYEVVSAR